MQNEAATVASVTKPRDGRTLKRMDTSEPDPPINPAFDWSAADRRRMPARLKRRHRKRPAPKPAVTEKVVAEQRQPLGECARCGTTLPASASTGRPRVYCTPAECVTMVLADPALARKVLIGLSRQVGSKRITPADDAFWDLVTSVEFLSEAFARAANRPDPRR